MIYNWNNRQFIRRLRMAMQRRPACEKQVDINMKQLYTALVTSGISFECIGDEQLGLNEGDQVVILCERYTDLARVTGKVGGPIPNLEEFERQRSLASKGRHIEGEKTPVIIRKANPEDCAKAEDNKRRAVTAHAQTRDRILAHGLEMKLIHTHYSLDGKLLLFQFSADGRIDFRELLRDLSMLFRARIELRQIGVRDEAAVLGGLGICGRPFCCSKFLHVFNSINVKMAKQQGVSLNPQNISGCCGRLKCCLYYEADAYKDVPVSAREKAMLKVDEADEVELAKLDEKESEDSSGASERTPKHGAARPGREQRPRREAPQAGKGQAPRPQREAFQAAPRLQREHQKGRHAGPVKDEKEPRPREQHKGDQKRRHDQPRGQQPSES